MIRYLITDGSAAADPARWLARAALWLGRGVELFQIRERELSVRQLAELTRRVLELPRPHGTKILVNDRADVALACGADGVHLRGSSVDPGYFRAMGLMTAVSCHQLAEVERAGAADFIVLAPIFKPLSKVDARPVLGLAALTQAAGLTNTPILALGGVSEANARLCLDAGAAGIAGISYFSNYFNNDAA